MGIFLDYQPTEPSRRPSQRLRGVVRSQEHGAGRGWLRVRVGNPACYFCAVWVPDAVGSGGGDGSMSVS